MPLDDRVLTALERSPYLARRNLRFETSAGRVTLRGVVNTYFQETNGSRDASSRQRRQRDCQRTGSLLDVVPLASKLRLATTSQKVSRHAIRPVLHGLYALSGQVWQVGCSDGTRL